jgi:hypothetical protein
MDAGNVYGNNEARAVWLRNGNFLQDPTGTGRVASTRSPRVRVSFT